MLLNNATNLLKDLAIIGGATRSGKVYDLIYPVIDTDGNMIKWWSGGAGGSAYGNSYTCNTDPFSNKSLNVCTSYSGSYRDSVNILVGNGTTPVTANDYSLESIINTVSKQSGSVVINYISNSNDKSITTKMTVKVAIKNTGTENITVSELGLCESKYTANNGGLKCILLYREVLDEPITILPEEFSTFQIDIEIVNSEG